MSEYTTLISKLDILQTLAFSYVGVLKTVLLVT